MKRVLILVLGVVWLLFASGRVAAMPPTFQHVPRVESGACDNIVPADTNTALAVLVYAQRTI